MTAGLRTFPDVEDVLLTWAKETFEVLGDPEDGPVDLHVGSQTPPRLAERLPFLMVARIGGGDNFVTDFATVSIDVFGAKRSDAYDLIEAVRERLLRTPVRASGAVLDNCRTRSGPQRAPWSGDDVVRINIEMEISARRR